MDSVLNGFLDANYIVMLTSSSPRVDDYLFTLDSSYKAKSVMAVVCIVEELGHFSILEFL